MRSGPNLQQGTRFITNASESNIRAHITHVSAPRRENAFLFVSAILIDAVAWQSCSERRGEAILSRYRRSLISRLELFSTYRIGWPIGQVARSAGS